ncbi:putative ABC substrate-binding protein-iron [Mycoplasma haemofelis Ohio2]|uniref:Putative ABC substrate-binding protein-iron n=1 Tax=Mycoplasma haemofelis (strain Ohio2) TaxID=859194 RepID=F6FGM5_MYCHI|nr:putative ABC substrate-binding protein-iron [Mycoplasma haemofelis Ohio2]
MPSKKLLVGTLTPVCALPALSPKKIEIKDYKIIVNYNGQADLLLSLQIPPDYYPYQFKKTALYDYLTDVDQYVITNAHTSINKSLIKVKLQSRLNELLGKVKEFGPSLWNEDLYDSGLVFRNDQFWNNKRASVLFLEQFVADDYVNIEDSFDLIPIHKDLIVTNYRAARDPYTIFSEEVFKYFENGTSNNGDKDLASKFKTYVDNYDKESINSLYRFGKYIYFWNDLFKRHEQQFKDLGMDDWLSKEKEKNNKRTFSLDTSKDSVIAKKYARVVFTDEEIQKLKEWKSEWKSNYESTSYKLTHHPALEQTTIPGAAPLAEGSQKEVVVFLFQFAALLDKYSKSDNFKTEFNNDYRKSFMESALKNAKQMASNLKTRIKDIREYLQKIQVVDSSFSPETGNNSNSNSNSKSLAIVTYPPSSYGAGEATIQSMSKFPFIYKDIGLKQVYPHNLSDHSHDMENDIFSVDDNGWWWKIGKSDLNSNNLVEFKNTADSLLILANPEDWSLLRDKNASAIKSLGGILKGNEEIDISNINQKGYKVSYNKYHLWNEGLRSPIALNLLLDSLVDILQKQYDPEFTVCGQDCQGSNGSNNKYVKAMDWGDYWSTHFINGTSVTS